MTLADTWPIPRYSPQSRLSTRANSEKASRLITQFPLLLSSVHVDTEDASEPEMFKAEEAELEDERSE